MITEDTIIHEFLEECPEANDIGHPAILAIHNIYASLGTCETCDRWRPLNNDKIVGTCFINEIDIEWLRTDFCSKFEPKEG